MCGIYSVDNHSDHVPPHPPGVEQLPALSVVILLQALEPMGGLAQPGAVQQVLEGGGHVEVLVDGEGHAVVHVVEKVVRPLVDGAHWVVHGNLKQRTQVRASTSSMCTPSDILTHLVQGLAAVDRVPAAGLRDQRRK